MSAVRVLAVAGAVGIGTAMAQQSSQVDATHCYVGTISTINRAPAYTAFGSEFRGMVRAAEPVGMLDRHVTTCVGTGGSLAGGPPRLNGYCEYSASAEDRLLLQWSIEAGRSMGSFACGTGRYKGASGEYSFQPVGEPFPAEAGVIRNCNRHTGEFRLP